MSTLKPTTLLVAMTVLAGAPLVSAQAQTAPSPTSPAPATRPETAPMPQTPPAQKPTPVPGDKSSAAPKANPLIGLAVFSSDGNKLGSVQSVATSPDGKATAIHLKTGGFLGIGGKLVAVPDGKFTKAGDRVQLSMTADEVSKLPEYKNNL